MRPTICVLGSANMDLVATVQRIPGVGETVAGTGFASVPGGKGANQALAAARAGARVRMLGAVGDDAFGARILRLLSDDGIDVRGVSIVAAPTGTAHIVVDAVGENQIVVVPGANGAVTELSARHRETITGSDVLLLQLELPLGVVQQAAAAARDAGVRTVLTPAPVVDLPDELLALVDLLVPNQHEAAGLTGIDDPVAAAEALRARGPDRVVVTLGADGCTSIGPEGRLDVPGRAVTAVDTTAAGDTFVGCLAVALAEGRPVADALRWATAAASLSVQRAGASNSMPTRAEVDRAVSQGEP